MGEWMHKVLYICTMLYYSAIKMNNWYMKQLNWASKELAWMKKGQSQKDTYYMFHLYSIL